MKSDFQTLLGLELKKGKCLRGIKINVNVITFIKEGTYALLYYEDQIGIPLQNYKLTAQYKYKPNWK